MWRTLIFFYFFQFSAFDSLFQPLLTAALWESRGNVPALVMLLKAYFSRAAEYLVAKGCLDSCLGIFQKLLASRATELHAFDLIASLMRYVPKFVIDILFVV
jgi:exportin-2 (importin alpha re-exporter)